MCFEDGGRWYRSSSGAVKCGCKCVVRAIGRVVGSQVNDFKSELGKSGRVLVERERLEFYTILGEDGRGRTEDLPGAK